MSIQAGSTRGWIDRSPVRGHRARGWIDRSGVRGVVRGVRWYVRELTGEAAYDRYVEHARAHGEDEPLTRAQWWRARDDARETTSHERCC